MTDPLYSPPMPCQTGAPPPIRKDWHKRSNGYIELSIKIYGDDAMKIAKDIIEKYNSVSCSIRATYNYTEQSLVHDPYDGYI